MTKLRSIIYKGRQIIWHSSTLFLVQVGSGSDAYSVAKTIRGNLKLALECYDSIQLEKGDKKRLVMPYATKRHILARTYNV
jgi:hypothetical protein